MKAQKKKMDPCKSRLNNLPIQKCATCPDETTANKSLRGAHMITTEVTLQREVTCIGTLGLMTKVQKCYIMLSAVISVPEKGLIIWHLLFLQELNS